MAKKNEEQLQKKEKEAIVIKQENQITQSKI
jgi:hypothetical protein